jgi:hypothetical protein
MQYIQDKYDKFWEKPCVKFLSFDPPVTQIEEKQVELTVNILRRGGRSIPHYPTFIQRRTG